jgi:asparagine synthase (glutamine-hydrolysing)
MCGIFGIVTDRPRDEIAGIAARATRALAHRGPDDEGLDYPVDEPGLTVAFSHRRLSILDLSPAGHQPMRDTATGDWITYNGEVFNFRALRSSFARAFRSESDTEVLLAGLARDGVRAIEGWRGMFALGWWDADEQQLTLVRDRLGIKPLYYYHEGATFIFASEVRALLATGLIERRLSRAAVESYLAYGSVQQPLTIIERVYAVLPGHTLSFARGAVTSTPYWELTAGEATVKDPRQTVAEIRDLIAESVRLRLVSDVPVGVFLSGGIDSSAVVSMLQRAGSARTRTFAVCFREDEFSEREHAERIAREFKTDHQSVLLTSEDALAQLPRALGAMDQPSIDGINSYVVSGAAAEAGLKVALSGLGGDEVFAGYRHFRTIARDEARRRGLQMVPAGVRRAAGSAIALAPGQRATKLAGLLGADDLGDHAVFLHRQLFTAGQREALLAENGFVAGARSRDVARWQAWTDHQLANCASADAVNQASALELGNYLANTLLRDTDAMSMAHGLEVRVPLIDHVLVERMMALPGAFKVRAGAPKWLLVEAVGDLPREIWARRKRGFELPFKHWLRGALRPEIEATFDAPTSLPLAPEAVGALWRDFLSNRVSWSRVWALFVLSRWSSLNR